jgi:hypothetical protein
MFIISSEQDYINFTLPKNHPQSINTKIWEYFYNLILSDNCDIEKEIDGENIKVKKISFILYLRSNFKYSFEIGGYKGTLVIRIPKIPSQLYLCFQNSDEEFYVEPIELNKVSIDNFDPDFFLFEISEEKIREGVNKKKEDYKVLLEEFRTKKANGYNFELNNYSLKLSKGTFIDNMINQMADFGYLSYITESQIYSIKLFLIDNITHNLDFMQESGINYYLKDKKNAKLQIETLTYPQFLTIKIQYQIIAKIPFDTDYNVGISLIRQGLEPLQPKKNCPKQVWKKISWEKIFFILISLVVKMLLKRKRNKEIKPVTK